jgi:phage recombination protein Bet
MAALPRGSARPLDVCKAGQHFQNGEVSMSTQLVTAADAAALRATLKNSLYPGANDASIDMVLGYCKAAGLDPMQKPVHIVPMMVATGEKDSYGNDKKAKRDIVMPGIGLYRINAARTGLYAGCSEPEFGPTRVLKYKRDVWEDGPNNKRVKRLADAELEYPEWCRIAVEKIVDGQVRSFTAKEYWLENYAEKGDSGAPNAMWGRRPFGQLAKCAEAQALRKAFPDAVGSQPTAEEMEGKAIDVDIEPTPPASMMPKAKPKDQPASTQHGQAEIVDAYFKDAPPPGVTGEGSPAPQTAHDAGKDAGGAGEIAGGALSDLTASQCRLVRAKAMVAGLKDDAAILAAYPDLSKATVNVVLKSLAEKAAA